MSLWDSFWGIFWWTIWFFAFVAYLWVVFAIISDLFRDHELNGWWKALWIVFLIFLPFLTSLVYLIARGRGMAERSLRDAASALAGGRRIGVRDVGLLRAGVRRRTGPAAQDLGFLT